jgi:hypothetical protein
VTVAIHQAWQLASIADEVPVGSFQAGTPGEGNELPEPADPDDRSADSNVRSICRYSAYAAKEQFLDALLEMHVRRASDLEPLAPVLAHERGRKPRASCRSSARAARARPRTPAQTPRSARSRARFRRRTRPRARQPGGTGASVLTPTANVASKKCWVRIISGRHSSDREPPAITPLGPTDSPARRVNMVESARRRYTTNRHLTAWAGRWTMTRSWTFV